MTNFTYSSLFFLLLSLTLGGCASLEHDLGAKSPMSTERAGDALLREIANYPYSIPTDQRVDIAALSKITAQMRVEVNGLFPKRSSVLEATAANRIANWMIDPDGLGITYDVDANFTPAQAFIEKRANCLSFTLLLRALAAEVSINIDINEVDIPANWGMNLEQNVVFYRHVNGIRLRGAQRQVFDLALDQFRFDYPQRRITEQHAYAQLLSNQAIDAFRKLDYPTANHLIKTALFEYAEDPNLWVNYGVITERLGNMEQATEIYRQALRIDRSTLVAITNLARVYEQFGRFGESRRLQKRAADIRSRNPYHHYFLAKEFLEQGDSKQARRQINKALSMYNQDARFYALRSRVWQLTNRYTSALRDMQKAYALSMQADEQFHFKNKAAWLAQQVNRKLGQSNARNLQTLLEDKHTSSTH